MIDLKDLLFIFGLEVNLLGLTDLCINIKILVALNSEAYYRVYFNCLQNEFGDKFMVLHDLSVNSVAYFLVMHLYTSYLFR